MKENNNSIKSEIWTFSFAALIFTAVLVSMCVSVIIPAMPIIMKQGGFSYSFITYTFVGLIIGRFISSNFAGWFLDRHLPQKILFATFLLHTVTMCCFAFVKSQDIFVLLRFLEGIFEGIVAVVLQVMVIALSTPSNRGRKMGIFSSSYGLGFILGPSVGGAALQWAGPKGVFLTVAILMLLGLVWLGIVYRSLAKDLTMPPSSKRSFNLEFLKFLPLYGGAILQRGLFVSLSILLPLYLVDVFKLQPYQVGFYFTASAIITTILMPLTGRLADEVYRTRIVVVSMFVMGISILGFGLVSSRALFTGLFLLETTAFSFMVPASMKIFGDQVDKHPHRGQIVGAASSSREILNVVLIFCLVPLYKHQASIPWIALGVMSMLLAIPYMTSGKRNEFVLEEVVAPSSVKA